MVITTIVAVYATTVSTASLAVAVLAYRAAGPKVSIRAAVVPSGPDKGSLQVEVLNAGRSDVTIDFEGIAFKRTPGFKRVDHLTNLKRQIRFMPLSPSGPDLPHRLRSNDRAKWNADLARVNWDLEHELDPKDDANVLLRVGAKRRRIPVQHYQVQVHVKPGRLRQIDL